MAIFFYEKLDKILALISSQSVAKWNHTWLAGWHFGCFAYTIDLPVTSYATTESSPKRTTLNFRSALTYLLSSTQFQKKFEIF